MRDLDARQLVFIDESGFRTSLGRTYGWAPCGEKPVIYTPKWGKNLTVVGAIALDGIRARKVVDSKFDGDAFIAFLRDDLGPNLKPGDIVVMDGPRLHRVKGVAEALERWGATPLYLPPYSPELNPIEMCWSVLKAWVRMRSPRVIERLLDSIDEAWDRVSAALCQLWVTHCGYVTSST
jgi:transposase